MRQATIACKAASLLEKLVVSSPESQSAQEAVVLVDERTRQSPTPARVSYSVAHLLAYRRLIGRPAPPGPSRHCPMVADHVEQSRNGSRCSSVSAVAQLTRRGSRGCILVLWLWVLFSTHTDSDEIAASPNSMFEKYATGSGNFARREANGSRDAHRLLLAPHMEVSMGRHGLARQAGRRDLCRTHSRQH